MADAATDLDADLEGDIEQDIDDEAGYSHGAASEIQTSLAELQGSSEELAERTRDITAHTTE
jgi:methyl-accepting chemotaxis protein